MCWRMITFKVRKASQIFPKFFPPHICYGKVRFINFVTLKIACYTLIVSETLASWKWYQNKGNIAESHWLFLWIWKLFSMLTFCSKLFFQNVEVSRKFFHEFQSKQKYCCSKRVKKIAHEMLLETFNFSIPDTHFFWKNALAAQCKHWNSGVVCLKGKVWKHGFDFESHLNFQRIKTNTSTEGSERAKIRFNGI